MFLTLCFIGQFESQSDCGAKDPEIPVATLKNGNTFGDGKRLTSTDALQIQNKYCSAEKFKASVKFFDFLNSGIV